MNWAWKHKHFLVRYCGVILVLLSISATPLYSLVRSYISVHAEQAIQHRVFLINANDALNLSNDVYTPFNKKPIAPAGWTVIKFEADPSGMQAAAFQNISTGQIVIAYEGTNPNNLVSTNANNRAFFNAQISADADIATNTIPQANLDAMAFARKVANLAVAKGKPIYVTGHSLGGEEAEYVQNQADQPGSTLTISGGTGFADPGVPNAQPAKNDVNFTSYLDYGDAIGNFVPSGGAHIGNVSLPLGDSQDQAVEIELLSASGIGGVVGLTAGAAAVSMMASNHAISHYFADLGIPLSTTANNESDIGISDIMEAFTAVGAAVFGGTGTPQDVNGNLVVNGNTLKVTSGAGEILFSDGKSTEILTGSSKKFNETTAKVNVAVASGNNETITAGAEAAAVLVAEGNNATLVAGSGKEDAFIITGQNATIDTSTVNVLAQDTVTFAGQSIAGDVYSGYTDQYGRTYTLNGTTLTIATNSNNTTNTLTINGFTSGDFGVDFGYTFTILDVPNATFTEIAGINNAGTVVGSCEIDLPGQHILAFSGTPPGALSTFRHKTRSYFEYALGINNNGQIVGSSIENASPYNTVSWLDTNGQFSTINVPGFDTVYADGINDNGQIIVQVSNSSNNNGITYYIYSSGQLTSVNVPGASYTEISAINDAGQIAGSYTDTSGNKHGFVDTNGNFTTIDIPVATNGTVITGINNQGQIVGDYSNTNSSPYIGFVGTLDASGNLSSYALINVPGSNNAEVSGINDRGQIAGYYYDSSSNEHSFIAIPVTG